MSTNSADVGSSIFAAIAIFAFLRTGSDVSEGWSDARPSVFPPPIAVVAFLGSAAGGCAGGGVSRSVMVREFAFSSTGSVSFRGLAAVGFAAIAAFLGFTVVILGAGLNGSRSVSSIGGQAQPINVAHRALMRSVLSNSISHSWDQKVGPNIGPKLTGTLEYGP
jgi:hypothetical protein